MLEIQDPVTVIGYPGTSDIGQQNTLNPTVTSGAISGKQIVGGTEWIQIQSDARPGNSGGPVLDKNGNVIGILSAGTDNTNNYIRPANDIKMLLNVENKLGMVDNEWRIGLIMYRLQHYSEAIKHFDAVLNLSGGHLLAQEYKAKAQANIGQDKPLTQETTTISAPSTITQETVSSNVEKTIPSEATKVSSKLTTLVLVLIIVIPLVLIIAIVIIIVVLVVKRRNVTPPKQNIYTQKPAQQVTTTIEEQKSEESKKEEKEEIKYCPNCGAKVEPDQVFCAKCGTKLK